VLQSTAKIACRVLYLLSKSVPKQFELLLLKIHLSRNKSLLPHAIDLPQPPSCALDTICELITPIYPLSSCY
jgi:hypothetical protein